MSCRLPVITLDGRSADDLLQEFWSRRLGYVPDWSPPNASAGAAMGPIFARFLQAILKRLNQAPDKNRLAFFDLLGLNLAFFLF